MFVTYVLDLTEFAEVMGFNRKVREKEAPSTSSTSDNGKEKKARPRDGSRASTTANLEEAHTSSVAWDERFLEKSDIL